MKFSIAADLEYSIRNQGSLILNIHALRTETQAVLDERLTIEPYLKSEELSGINGENRLVRMELKEKGKVKISYQATVDNSYHIKDYTGLPQIQASKLDPQVLPFLFPSRYCQSDKLYRLAGNLFGQINDPFEKVLAITEWIYSHVEYQSGSTNSQTSAFDTVTEQAGVCRDFAHLGIALCRAQTIPARYFAGYAYALKPADFHACFEAFIGDEWVLFDATRLAPLNGLIKIATGRDAADTSVANIFGDISLESMQVSCGLAEEGFEPFFR